MAETSESVDRVYKNPSPERAAVRLKGVVKSFGSTIVLDRVDLDFRQGEVHALIGENGAGKSTLGKIIGGYHHADAGDVEIFGERVEAWSPRRALQRGIAMIHQEIQLVPELTAAANVFLGAEHNFGGVLWGSEVQRYRDLERRCGCRFGVDPDAVVGALSIAERQKVEILRAIGRGARVIIMDEPASSLTADEVARLHEVIARLKSSGTTIIYVTHFLDHALSQADRVTVMRDGAVVHTANIADETKQSLVEAMLGESADLAFPALPARPSNDAAPLLAVERLSTDTGLTNVSLTVKPGEIVGLIGLIGSGRTELARAIFGADPLTGGVIRLCGEPYTHPSPSRSVERGLVLVPEDRRKQGLVLTQRTRPNMALPHLKRGFPIRFLAEGFERRRARELIAHFEIQPDGVDGAVLDYSGGNQQKVLMSKWIFVRPRVMILDEPSRGVDIGARRRIHEFIVEAAREGAAILLISSELEEVVGLSHRSYLMRDGRILGEIDSQTARSADILFHLLDIGSDAAATNPSPSDHTTSST
jgi:ribose transport system ATP-binding protein